MKKIVFSVLSASLLLGSHGAMAKGLDYAGAGLAFQDVDGMSELGVAIYGNAGIKMPEVHKNFRVEGEASYSLVDASRNDIDVSILTLGGYGAYQHFISGELRAKARAGLVFARSEVDCGALCKGDSDSDIDLSLGVGLIYNYQSNMKLTADWTIVTNDISHLSAGVRYEY